MPVEVAAHVLGLLEHVEPAFEPAAHTSPAGIRRILAELPNAPNGSRSAFGLTKLTA